MSDPSRIQQALRLTTPLRPYRNLWRLARRRLRGSHYNILGISSTGHGASLALISSRYGVRALNLDRFAGRKYALLLARDEFEEIRAKRGPVAAGLHQLLARNRRLPPVVVFEDHWEEYLAALAHGLPLGARDIDLVVSSESCFAVNRAWLGRKLAAYFPNAAVYTDIEHHDLHRYQAFLASPFEKAAVLTIDSCGEALARLNGRKLAITLADAEGSGFEVFAEHCFPESSPGLLYAIFNRYLGFAEGEEGKTMGLASYGTEGCHRRLAPHLKLSEDGAFAFLNSEEIYATLHECGARPRSAGEAVEAIHGDVALAAQMLLDGIVTNCLQALKRRSRHARVCLAGGVALNSVSNERAFRASGFADIFIMPNAGDCGLALGAALYAERVLLRRARAGGIPSDSLGAYYAEDSMAAALEKAGLRSQRVADLAGCVAEWIERGRIVGWFQGGSEYGPRALGHRSILADARPAEMKDYLNERVKHREAFRPYAPAVLEEKAAEWFDLRGSSPFMLRVVDVLPEKRGILGAVTHVDGTARVQTVSRETNPRFYDVVAAFERRTGVPVILNTSFNVAGRPIVETPEDAIECFLATNIDALVLGDFAVEKAAT